MPLTLAELSQIQQCLSDKGIPQDQMEKISDCLELVLNPPPDPGPGPDPGNCLEGSRGLVGFWRKWCGDEERNFADGPNGSYGIMRSNADAVRFITDDGRRYDQGAISFEVYFPTNAVPQGGGGKHLFSPSSKHKYKTEPQLKGWLRPDHLPIKRDGVDQIMIHTYNLDGNGNRWYLRNGSLDVVVDIWYPGVPISVGRWIPLSFGWNRTSEDRIQYNLNGKTKTVEIHKDSLSPSLITVGNMDSLSGFGGTPEVWYRNFAVHV